MPLNVALEAFDGPLDLLLHLVEKNKVSIFDIPIVEITDQYLEYVRKLETEDLALMSEFMVMAAELISIKCKMLLPPEVDEEGEEVDPRKDLVQQLLEYKMYKYMSYELKDRLEDASKIFYKGDTTPKEVLRYRPNVEPEELLEGLTLKRLHEIFGQVLRRQESRIDPIRSQFGTIKKEDVRLEDKLLEVADLARRRKRFSFRELLKKQKSRMQTIVTFLAMLELMKYGIVEAEQEDTGGEIVIRAVEGADLKDAGIEEILAENGEA